MALGLSKKASFDEKVTLPEKPMEMDDEGLIISAPRENFYNSLAAEHWFLLGVWLNIQNSEATLHRNGSLTVELVAEGFSNIKAFKEGKRSIDFGPLATGDVDSATTFISSIVGFSKLMLRNFSGNQVFKRTWTVRIHFPPDCTLLNANELNGKKWILNFGGGTYYSASLSVDGGMLILNEDLTVTESEKVNPTPLGHYKSFTVEYLSPDSPPPYGSLGSGSFGNDFPPDSRVLWEGSIVDINVWWDRKWNETVYYDSSGKVEIWIHGNLSFRGKILTHIDLDSAWVEPSVNVSGLIEAGFTGEINYDKTWEFIKPKTGGIHKWFYFWLGPVYGVLDVNIRGELTFHFEAWGKVNVSTKAWCYASLKAGAKWSFWSGFKTIWEPYFDYGYTEPKLKWEAGLLSELRVGFPISALVYGAIGPEADPGIYFDGAFVVTGETDHNITFDWGLELGVDIYVGVRIGIPYIWYHSWKWRITYFPIVRWGTVSPRVEDEIAPTTRLWSYSPPLRDYHDILPGDYWWEGKNWTGPFTPYWFAAKDTAQKGAIPRGVDKTKYKVDVDWESGGSSSSGWKEFSYTGKPFCYNISLSDLYGSNSYPVGYHDITITAYSIDKANNEEIPWKVRHLKTDTHAPQSFIEAPEEIRAYITPIYINATDMSPHSGTPFIGTGLDIHYRVWHDGTWSSWMNLRRDPYAKFDHPVNHKTGDYNWSFDYLSNYPDIGYSTLKFKLYGEGKNIIQFFAIDGVGNREENHTVTYMVLPPIERGHYNFSNIELDWTELSPSGRRGNVTFTLPDGARQCSEVFAVVNITYSEYLANASHRLRFELYDVNTHSWKRKSVKNEKALIFPRGDRSDHEIIVTFPHPENWNVDKIRFVTGDPNSFTNVTSGYFYYYIPGAVHICYSYPCLFAGEDRTPIRTYIFDLEKDDYVGYYIEIEGDLKDDLFKYQLYFNGYQIEEGDLGKITADVPKVEFKPSWDMSTFGCPGEGYLKILWIDDDNPGAGAQLLGVSEPFEISIGVSRERLFEVGDPKYPPDTGLWITSRTELSYPYPPPENWSWRVTIENPLEEQEYWEGIFTGPFSFTASREGYNLIKLYLTHPTKNDTTKGSETHYVDDTPPVSSSHLGNPYYTNGVNEWISSDTEITLSARDRPAGYPVGVKRIYFRYDYGSYTTYSNPFTIPTECKHNLQYYSEDHLGNTESTNTRPLYVDNTPPTTTLSFGMPYWSDGRTEWVTPWTPIYLDVTDYPSCGPSGVRELHFDFSGDSQPEKVIRIHDQVGHTETYHFEFDLLDLIRPSDKYWGPQTITWYAVDNLGHKEPTKTRQIKVVIPLHLEPEQWFLDGAHQTHPGYTISSAPEPTPGEGHTCLKWTIHVDKNDPYSGLVPPNGFVDIYYNNQGMDWSQVESIDTLIYASSDQIYRDCNKPDRTKIYEIIHNPKDAWKHDLSTDSTQVACYDDGEVLLNQWNTYYWNLTDFDRDNLKSFMLRLIQNDDNYCSDQETLTIYIRGILVAGPIGIEDGTQHPLADITANTHDFTVTDTDGDWCFEHNIQHAVNWAKEGLTITVEEGTYYENVYMFRDDVTLQNSSKPVIDGRQLGSTVTLAADNLTIKGFEIKNGTHGIYADGTSAHTIHNCEIHSNQNHGVYLTDSQDHSLYNNYMYSNHEDGIHAENVINTEINNCIISGNNGNGIYLKDTSNININNCGISGNYNGIYGDGVSDTTIQNNEIHSNKNNRGYGGAGIMFISDTNGFFNNKITNNHIYDNARQGIFLGWYGNGNPIISKNNQITYNSIHHNGLDEVHPPDASRYGIHLANADNNLIENNEIYDHYQWNVGGVPWGAGIYLWASYENQIKNNHLYRNDQHVRCWSGGSQRTPGPNYINYNYFCKQYDEPCISPVVGVANYDFDTTAVVDARYNWWKAPSGPSSPPDENNYDMITGRIADGLGAQVIGPVNFDPWAGLDSLIKVSQTSALTGETIVFNAKDSFACHMDGTYYDYRVLWDFDDGTYSDKLQTGHVFATPGVYHVSLRVEANDNALWPNIMYDWSNITITISAPGQPLTANADSENLGGYKGITGKPIQFYGSATGGKPPYTFYWDFGDYSNTVTEQNPTHVYSTPGTYTVTLTVIDTESNTATDTVTVTVKEPQPLQIDAGGPYTGTAGEKIWFSVTVNGGIPPYTFEWDFGDNTPLAHGRSPIHTYKQPGIYIVTVIARDQIGTTATDTTEVIVKEGSVEPEDNVRILSIQGGFGVKATIEAGDTPVDWTITIDGKLVFGETQCSGTIPANTVEIVRTSRVLGLGPIDITVTANRVTKEAKAFMIGPLVLLVKET